MVLGDAPGEHWDFADFTCIMMGWPDISATSYNYMACLTSVITGSERVRENTSNSTKRGVATYQTQ